MVITIATLSIIKLKEIFQDKDTLLYLTLQKIIQL